MSTKTINDKKSTPLFCRFFKMCDKILEKYEIMKRKILHLNSFIILELFLLFFSY